MNLTIPFSRSTFSFSRSEFINNVVILAYGTGIAQVILIMASPFLSRLYTPSDFGIMTLYVNIAGILAVIATGRFELTIQLPKSDEEAANIVALCIGLVTIFSLVIFLFLFNLGPIISQISDTPELEFWLPWVPATVFFLAIFRVLYYWGNRKKFYPSMASARVTRSGVLTGVQVALGWSGISGGLIIGTICGHVLSVISISSKIFREARSLITCISKSIILKMAKRYRRFSGTMLASNTLGTLNPIIPAFYLATYFDLSVLGFFYMADRLVFLPVSVLAHAIGDVFRQRAAEDYHRDGRFDRIFLKTLKMTAVVGLIPALLIFWLAPDIFSTILGEEWRVSGEYARILILSGYFSFFCSPVDKAALIREKSTYMLIWHITRLLGNVLAVGLAIFMDLSVMYYLCCLVGVRITLYFIDLLFCYSFSLGK